MTVKTAILAGVLAFSSVSASAQSLKDLRARDADEAALSREADYTSKVCDRPISARIDWASAARWPADLSLADACDGALGAVETICRAGRKNVVKEFICAGDGSGPSLSGGTLRYGAARDASAYATTLAVIGAAE